MLTLLSTIKTILFQSTILISQRGGGKLKVVSWKDSFRLFPVSLDQLCKTFGCYAEGKTQTYNPAFNDISLFDSRELFNQFLEYSRQDSIALYQALTKAQEIYLEKYFVDITKVLSASSLSLLIFSWRSLESFRH